MNRDKFASIDQAPKNVGQSLILLLAVENVLQGRLSLIPVRPA